MSSARRLYRLNLFLAALAGGAVALAALAAISRLRFGVPSGEALLAACRHVVPLPSAPALIVVIALTALGLVVVSLAARSLFRQLRAQLRLLSALERVESLEIAGQEVTVIGGTRPRAFCAGLLRPRIYLSAPTLEALSSAQLEAVVAHEAHHRRRRDPLRIFFARVLTDALFFLPGLRRLSQRYHELAEVAADEAAGRVVGGEHLAAALLAFGDRGVESPAVVGIAPERVDHLLGQPPRWGLPASAFAGSLAVVAALLAVVAALPAIAERGSVSLAMLLAEGCMVAMFVAPLAAGTLALSLSWRRVRRALT